MLKSWEAAYIAGVIDGEGSITLTRMHKKEHRRPCISIASTDLELLTFDQSLTGGIINTKKNYKPEIHNNSFTLTLKSKKDVCHTLKCVLPFLRISQKKHRAMWILDNYNLVTPRNGKYSTQLLKEKLLFEERFFQI
jgi:hypothetical protein